MKNLIAKTFERSDFVNWKDHLDTEGYVVIKNVLSEEEMKQGIELFWKDWNQVSPGFVRTDPTTWSIQTSPMMFAKGMAVFNGFGQCDFMWYLRTRQHIFDIFTKIHNTTQLITSFDGFSVFFTKKQKSPKDWFHIDQHPNNQEYSIQGAYNFMPVKEDSAGFTLVPRSHRTFTPTETKVKKDWIQIHSNKPPDEAAAIIADAVKLLIPANCFVLWNSKTIHANTGISSKIDKNEINRLTAYITFAPILETYNKELRTKVYLAGDTTSHWPNKVEVKKYPWGFGPNYEAKGFGKIKPESTIPEERKKYI